MSVPKVGVSNGGEGGLQSRWPCSGLEGQAERLRAGKKVSVCVSWEWRRMNVEATAQTHT